MDYSQEFSRRATGLKMPLGGIRYNFFSGSTSTGKQVNEHTAMQMMVVYSCVRILSETLAGL